MNPCDISENTVSKHRCRYWRRQRRSRSQREKRIVFKTGEFNIEKSNKKKYNELPDLVTALTEVRWRWTILYSVFAYVSNWLIFAIVWWIILYIHGDLDRLPKGSDDLKWQPCVREIHNFTSAFLFSIEIHTTIGYGRRAITEECASAVFTMCIESIIGKIIQSLIIGIVFAKLTRPKNRAYTLMFSKNVIVNQRDTNLCLTFRVGNVRKSRIIGVTIAAYLIKYVTIDGDILNYEQVELKLDIDSNADIFAFPLTALHVINETSPFYNISAIDILKSSMEILVVLEGIIESTGQIVQAKSSYTNCDIVWGRRFVNPIFYRKMKRGFIIDYIKFDEIRRINTPLCTGKDLHKYYQTRKELKNVYLS